MSYSNVIIAFIITMALTIIITPLIIRFAKKIGVVDKPNYRKKHNGHIPLLGGLAIFIPVVIGIIYLQPEHNSLVGVYIGATIILITGIVDDVFNIKPVMKLLFYHQD